MRSYTKASSSRLRLARGRTSKYYVHLRGKTDGFTRISPLVSRRNTAIRLVARPPSSGTTRGGYPVSAGDRRALQSRLADANDVRAITVAPDGDVWTATRGGFFRWRKAQNRWSDAGGYAPAFTAFTDSKGHVWLGAWNGLYRVTDGALRKVEDIAQPVSALCEVGQELIAFGPDSMWRVREGRATAQPLPCAASVRSVLPDGKGCIWIGTDAGLFHHSPVGTTWWWDEEHLLSASVRALAFAADGCLWMGGWVVL